MRLIPDPRTNADFIDGEFPAVDASRFGQLDGGERDQLVRPLQVVVLQQRFIDLLRKDRLVLRVRLHRIEMLGTLGEREIQDALAALRRRIGVVPDLYASGEKNYQYQRE